MIIKKVLAIVFICYSSLAFAYQDEDLDGVDDSIDQCLNTPFDELVDVNGCTLDAKKGSWIVRFGSDISFEDIQNRVSSFNIAIDYNYANFLFSISNYSYYENYQNYISDTNSLYLNGGYMIRENNLDTFFNIGSKLILKSDENSQNDYFASLELNYSKDKKSDIFVYGSYTISGKSDTNNYLSLSIGSGYLFSEKFYSSISYDYSSSYYVDTNPYSSISIFSSYQFNKRYFTTLNYAYALDQLSLTHTISLRFGIYYD